MAAPNRGDIVWISFDPQAGHEQASHVKARRGPALVLSPREYNSRSSYCVVCPITSAIKGYPFEVVLPAGLAVTGAVLADQLKSIDRHARRIEVVGQAPKEIVEDVTAKAVALVGA